MEMGRVTGVSLASLLKHDKGMKDVSLSLRKAKKDGYFISSIGIKTGFKSAKTLLEINKNKM